MRHLVFRLTESDLGHVFLEAAISNVCFSCSSEQTNSVDQAGSSVARAVQSVDCYLTFLGSWVGVRFKGEK